ncbi:type I polyketide synthase [Actinacidiphila epipremni]|uniref:SDR family NAD(P)-dependent oxidoreductase n=1 Tax=Actinacidiphila epipremni TaxID=2053013 RepID=A0ABX0ZR57_9ACTN|nr:type I polyketide synthase [Actinacidiphila epipremni]NJP45292.1 SDR family NAD(P)-dependent oxidoreductase [Actinacidiphila epipremni]
MDDKSTAAPAKQTPLTRALDTIRQLRQRLDEQQGNQPVAVVGIGLRLPGGIEDLDGYWAALAEGRDLVTTMPEHRKGPFGAEWDGLPQRGGYLDEVLDFDAAFFGISPREARHLDPQHRLLLEVAWEALEDAGLPADRLAGSRTGFYLGIMWQDYRDWLAGEPDAYWTTGNGHNFAAGRIAYALGLNGPALSVDTACSSSLVSVHLAVQALRRGECETAFAAGANLMMSPRSMRLVQETRSLSPDGLCRTFDARAGGFTRGEGCGVLVLKRLDHALRDGDRVHAVIRGTAVNQDGRSGGFTAPNVLSQGAVIEQALAEAGLEPADIGYVEAHGTGTALGDPIEMEALAMTLGRRNGGRQVQVGAVKTNLGHLESAAGVAGLVKAVLCLRERKIPPLVHFRTLNPRIDLSGTGITVPAELTDWAPESGQYAGVSSFGMSGTNAHVVLGAAPEAAPVDVPAPAGFPVSARTPEALRALAARYAAHLDTLDGADYPAFAASAATGRTRMEEVAWIAAPDARSAAAKLRALASGAEEPAPVPDGLPEAPRVVAALPPYPWQRRRFAPEAAEPPAGTAAPAATPALPVHHRLTWTQLPAPEPGAAGALWGTPPRAAAAPDAGGTDAPGAARASAPGAAPAARFVLAGDDAGLLGRLARAADAAGVRGTLLAPPGVDVPDGWAHQEPPGDAAGWDGFWAAAPAGDGTALVLVPAAADFTDFTDGAGPGLTAPGAAQCAAVTTAVAALARTGHGRATVVTSAVRRTADEPAVRAGSGGMLHGLGPVLGLEFPETWAGLADLPDAPDDADLAALLGHLAAQATTAEPLEDLTAVRAGAVHAARLTPAEAPAPPRVTADATYVVTGALGAVGRELTDALVRQGARHLLLLGRRDRAALTPEAAAFLDRLEQAGVQAVYRGGGSDTPQALEAALSALSRMPAVRGVVHAAGVVHHTPAAELTAEGMRAELDAKAAGAWWLHLASRDWPLDFFVLVSSVSSVWGTEGHAAYSAANGALDALAAHRLCLGLPAASVAFGPWDLAGQGMADTELRERSARLGIGALDATAGRAALTAAAPGPDGLLIACPLDTARLRATMAVLRPRGLLTGPARPPAPAAPGVPSLAAELAALPERDRAEAARAHVARLVARQLGHADAADLRTDVGFYDQGLDSITAVDLAVSLSAAFGTTVQVTDVFDHPTVAALAAHLLAGPAAPAAPVRRPAAPAPVRQTPSAAPGEPDAPHGDRNAEPVAIVGMAGRFPQAPSVEDFWTLLAEGRDGVTAPPEGRWDEATLGSERITTLEGGYLTDVDLFDSAFFAVPAREADSLDPQQRLLLESAWHALEDGGIPPERLRGTRTGVFVGIGYADYARLLARGGIPHIDAYYSTGTALNAAAGRIAYTLGLNGPAMAVDTACSSSLVALHLAVRSLRSGESDTALAGGVNILLDPSSWTAVSQAHMLSPTGRCRTFAADADGFARSEGVGVLVLKRLSDARRDGDRVLAVIRGSAVNQDGASSGLTVPNGTAQEAMLTAALADAATEPGEVSYLEAHGTGTSIGDPIEVGAAWRVLGAGRDAGDPLLLGSVKSNVGHCETASGMAAVFKTVLALRHETIPADLHFGAPNPHVPWDAMHVKVVDSAHPWPRGDRPRVAGVSGFGFTGTNAHLVLSDAPSSPFLDDASETGPQPGETAAYEHHLLPLSAPDADGVQRLTAAWRERLAGCADQDVPALVARAGAGRSHFPYRRAVTGRGREQLLAALDAPGAPAQGRPGGPKVAFLYTGQGSQFFGMGRELYETEPVFREVFDACDAVVAPSLGASLTDLVLYGDDRTAVNETRVTQPALVTLQTALTALWASWGVTPAVVLGHSVGEISAAITAGVVDRATGLALIAERARLMQGTRRGAMLAVAAPEEQARAWTEGLELDVAVLNGPEATVISGDPDAVDALAARLKSEGVKARRLTVSHAFHSRLLDPAMDDFSAALREFTFADPHTPLITNVTGRLARPGEIDAGYWRRHARGTVRFLDGLRQLGELDVDVCLEIGPDRTLVNMLKGAGVTPPRGTATSLRRGSADRAALLNAAKVLYEAGQDLHWARLHPAPAHDGTAPRYPFARTRHWAPAELAALPPAAAPQPQAGPPWGTRLNSPGLRGRVWRTERTTAYPAHLTDHRLFGVVSVPGASQTATALSALGEGGAPVELADLYFPRALVLHDGETYELQVVDDPDTGQVSIRSLVDAARGEWQQHLSARVLPATGPAATAPDPQRFAAAAERRLTGEDFYGHLRALGYHLGPSFRWIDEVWIRGDEALIRYATPDDPREDPASYEIHPGLLDSVLQSAVVFAVRPAAEGLPEEEAALAIPFALARVSFPGRPTAGRTLWGHITATRHSADGDGLMQVESADLHLFDDTGRTVLAADDFRFRRAPRTVLERSLRGGVPHAYQLVWRDTPALPAADTAARPLRIALLGGEGKAGRALRDALEARGHQVVASGAELVVDARFAEDACAPATAQTALAAAGRLAGSLRESDLPYAVLAPEADEHAPVTEALWGMLASVEAEQPGRLLLRLTLTADWQPAVAAAALERETAAAVAEPRLLIGAHGVRAARLAAAAETGDGAPTGGAALITGGLGALGLSAARTLVGAGCTAVTLMGRSEPGPDTQAALDELAAGGARVATVRGDVTEPADCRAAIAAAGAHAPLRAVLHLAGATADRSFDQLTADDFAAVFAAKAAGAENLAAALGEGGGDGDRGEGAALVLFSSASAVLGSAGQANYAAANGFLAGLARRLRASGVRASAVDWGPWIPAGGGGLADSAAARAAVARQGLRPLGDDEAGDLLLAALGGTPQRLVAVALDADAYAEARAARTGGALAGLLDTALLRRPAPPASSPAAGTPARGWLYEDLAALPAEDRDEQLRAQLRRMVAATVGAETAADDDLGFAEAGLDSIMIIDLRGALSEALGRDFPATVALDHPTVARLAAHALGVLFPAPAGPPVPDPGTPPVPGDDAGTDTPDLAGDPGGQAGADLAGLSFDELLQAVQADVTREK